LFESNFRVSCFPKVYYVVALNKNVDEIETLFNIEKGGSVTFNVDEASEESNRKLENPEEALSGEFKVSGTEEKPTYGKMYKKKMKEDLEKPDREIGVKKGEVGKEYKVRIWLNEKTAHILDTEKGIEEEIDRIKFN
jgi:hypothetical protein